MGGGCAPRPPPPPPQREKERGGRGCVTLQTWEWPGDEARNTNYHIALAWCKITHRFGIAKITVYGMYYYDNIPVWTCFFVP